MFMYTITILKHIFTDYYISAVESPKHNCNCNDEFKKMKLSIEKSQQQILTQLLLNNSNQIKVCNYLETMDKKINKILESDKKLRSSAIPLPKIPAPFLGLLPIATNNNLEMVEKLLSSTHEYHLTNKEELVLIIYILYYIHYITIINM